MPQKSMGWWQERSGRGMCSGGHLFLLKASLRLLHPGGMVKDELDLSDFGTNPPTLGSRGAAACE